LAAKATDLDALRTAVVKLPLLNVELPLNASFVLGSLVFLVAHADVLLHFLLLPARSATGTPETKTILDHDHRELRNFRFMREMWFVIILLLTLRRK
jgi:hypothetical protein